MIATLYVCYSGALLWVLGMNAMFYSLYYNPSPTWRSTDLVYRVGIFFAVLGILLVACWAVLWG